MPELPEDVSIRAGTHRLLGEICAPRRAVGLAIFGLASGTGRFSARIGYVAEALRARGLATLVVDLLTENEELVDRIDASLRFDIGRLADRLSRVTDWALADPRWPISYVGIGTGAAAALMTAARRPEVIHSIVSSGGRPDLVAASLPRVRAPTLLIAGGLDAPGLARDRDAITRMTTPTQLAVIPGASHLFEEPGALEEVARLAGEWVVDHSGQPRSAPAEAERSRIGV